MSTDAELAPESDPEAPAAGAAPETADAVEAAPDAEPGAGQERVPRRASLLGKGQK